MDQVRWDLFDIVAQIADNLPTVIGGINSVCYSMIRIGPTLDTTIAAGENDTSPVANMAFAKRENLLEVSLHRSPSSVRL